jgi:hypothetical protein
MLPSMKFQKFQFNYFLKFLQDYINLANCTSSSKIFFLKIQNGQKIQYMADFLHKNSWFFGSGTAEWNVLIFGYVILLALFYCKKLWPVLKNQNGVYIQVGIENVYIYHPLFSKIKFLSVFAVFLLFFYILGKNRTFFSKIRPSWIWAPF